ncbi:MAG: NnrU family protein [Alphaproteobacteria bacterium]
MAELALAALVFLGLHILPAIRAREWIIKKIGDPAYMGLFSLASVLGLAWMIAAYNNAPDAEPLWVTGPAIRWFTAALMLFVFVLVVAGVTTRNPSMVMGENALKASKPWAGIFAITRHPLMWGIALWAALHMLNRPDMVSLLFFGTLALLAVAGSKLQEKRKREELGAAWKTFEKQTSFVPFAGIIDGRTKLRLADIGGWRLAAATALWAIMLYAHGHVIGVPVLPL